MDQDLMLRRKWTFRAHDKQIVLVKKSNERSAHVFMKIFVWALYLPLFSNLKIEVDVGGRYKPDVVSLDQNGRPLFWGEAGYIATSKLHTLLKKYGSTHFAIAKWDSPIKPLESVVKNALEGIHRDGPVDLICFPKESANIFIDDAGNIDLTHDKVEWIRL
jgi:hypothetical protein